MEKQKKKHGCLIAIVVFVIFGVIVSGMSSEDSGSSDSASAAVETLAPTAEPTTEPTEEPTETPASEQIDESKPDQEESAESEEPLMSMDMTAAVIEALVSKNFENYKVDYDDSGITLSLWQDGLAAGSILAAAGNQESVESWNNIRENLLTFSDSVYETMETAGHGDAILMINILNDQNTENVLLSVVNGTIVYDAVSE